MKEYRIPSNDLPGGMELTVLLSDEDAKVRGLKPADAVETKARVPANKAAAPANKSA